MLLAIDVGNTSTALALYAGERLVADWRISSSPHPATDEIWSGIKGVCDKTGTSVSEITGVAISSVVPDLTIVFETLARKDLKVEPLIVSAALDLGFKILYKDPMAVGADRLCNAMAGYRKYGGPLIIIDFGTATTFDVVSKEGDYLGGVIALGLESSAAALHRRAALLPRIELRFPASAIGRDTEASMQAGVLFGTVDAVEGIVRRIRKELGAEAKVIATGGLAQTVAKHTSIIEACEPALVLEGVRLIYERIAKNRS